MNDEFKIFRNALSLVEADKQKTSQFRKTPKELIERIFKATSVRQKWLRISGE